MPPHSMCDVGCLHTRPAMCTVPFAVKDNIDALPYPTTDGTTWLAAQYVLLLTTHTHGYALLPLHAAAR